MENKADLDIIEEAKRRNNERIFGWLPIATNEEVLICSAPSEEIPVAIDWLILNGVEHWSVNELRTTLEKAPSNCCIVLFASNRLSYSALSGHMFIEDSTKQNGDTDRHDPDYRVKYTKRELKNILKGMGLIQRWYYLFPFHSFVTDIYSDEWLPDVGGYHEDTWDYSVNRLQFQDEPSFLNTLIHEGLSTDFADSFLIIASKNDIVSSKAKKAVSYIHYSPRRDDKFQTKTEMYKLNNEIHVVKETIHSDSLHLLTLADHYKILSEMYKDTQLKWDRVDPINRNKVELTFIQGQTLENILDELFQAGKYDEWIDKIKEYFNMFILPGKQIEYTLTNDFEQIFGSFDGTEMLILGEQKSLSITDIDCLFENAVCKKNGYVILDYEWTFSFPIPWKFVEWRCVFYFLNYRNRTGGDIEEAAYQTLNIGKQEQRLFSKMETNFQKYVLGNGLYKNSLSLRGNKIYPEDLTSKVSSLKGQILSYQNKLNHWNALVTNLRIQVYYDYGHGFSEEHSFFLSEQYNEKNEAIFNLDIPNDTVAVRIDPAMTSGLLEKFAIVGEKQGIANVEYANMVPYEGKQDKNIVWLAKGNDPNIIISNLESDVNQLRIELIYCPLVNKEEIVSFVREMREI
ncbi:hypothetical protein ACKX2L_10305 [Lachnospiraceae bacterium YH-ros2228]